MNRDTIFRGLCKRELEEMKRCLQAGNVEDANYCLTRIGIYKRVYNEIKDENMMLQGGELYFSQYKMDVGKSIDQSTESEILNYIQMNPPTEKQVNGARNELQRYYISKGFKSSEAYNKAAEILNEETLKFSRAMQEQREEKEVSALSNFFKKVPDPGIIDLTMENVFSQAPSSVLPMITSAAPSTSSIIDLTTEPSQKIIDPKQTQILLGAAAVIVTILVGPGSPQLKFFALVIIYFIYKILDQKYINFLAVKKLQE